MPDNRQVEFRIFRFDPDSDTRPYFKNYTLTLDAGESMVLDALVRIKSFEDDSLSFRRSCREGVYGSDGMNINGKNRLACVTSVNALSQPVVVRPLPGMPVVRDLMVDLTQFWLQYHSVRPFLVNDDIPTDRERLQSPGQRDALNGLYECILCACCTSACPTFWWNPDRFVGPAGLLQAYRFIADSRDDATNERLDNLEDAYRLFRCRTIMNCTDVCPKDLSPAYAISEIRHKLTTRML